MATVPKIESSNLSIADLFRDFYSVPDFQREYVWEKSNVEKLLEDIYYELYEDDRPLDDAEYFLGSLVVFKDSDGIFQLIDGQQRVTTIYLTFCVLRNYIHELKDKSQALENLIAGVTSDLKTGEDINLHRLSLQYDSEGALFLKEFADSSSFTNKNRKNTSSSVDNLNEAIQTIQDFLENNFKGTSQELKKFSSLFANQVKLIRIETPNLKNALRVFETINDRGVGLTPIDLLKNYLFINTSKSSDTSSYWQKLKTRWDKLMKNLYDHKENPMRFLRYYLMSHYEVNLSNNFPEEDIYDWFSEKGDENNITKEPLIFVEQLINASEHYCKFNSDKNIDGSDNKYLQNIRKLQGRYSQHLILLLAGRHLEKNLFEKLCEQVENLLFVYTITRSGRRKDINMIRNFSQWSKDLRSVQSSEDLSNFINKYVGKEFKTLANEFQSSFREMTDSGIAKFRLRYILAKIAQFLDDAAYDNGKPLTWYLDKSIHVEHILPQSSNPDLINSFDQPSEYSSYVRKLGNLTLLEKTINTAIADNLYEQKKEGYRQSQLLMTRSLVDKSQVGNNTQLNRALATLEFKPFDNWSSTEIIRRQEMFVKLANKVWGLSPYIAPDNG